MKILKVGEQQYVVKYTINSLVQMEQDTGKPFTELFDEEKGVSIGSLRTIVYYGLLSMQHDMTPTKAGAIMGELIEEGKTLMEVSAMFLSELTGALGMVSEEGDNPNE